MFAPNSRYANAQVDQVRLATGRAIAMVRFPVRNAPPLLGYHRMLEGQTLDQLAAFYLKDPTRFWAICDANGHPSPHALRARELVAIPARSASADAEYLPDLDGWRPAAAEFYSLVGMLEVEENADAPASLVMRLPVGRSPEGDLTQINEAALQPLKPLAVMVTPAEDGEPGCIFDGVVLGHKIHIESGLRSASLEVFAQDRSWLMAMTERTKEWANLTDSMVAAAIFSEHEIVPGPHNGDDDSGPYTEDTHTLMQRGSDLDFLRLLARRGGRHLRVAGGLAPGAPFGIFAKPALDGEPALILRPNDADAPNTGAIDIEWDVMRPTATEARSALFTDPGEEGVNGDTDESGLDPLGERGLADFADEPMSVVLTAVVDDGDQLERRSRALLAEAQWFVRCTTEVDMAAVGVLVRAGDIVRLDTVGSVHSGKYLAWSVRHTIGSASHKMNLTLVRNGVGPAPGGGAAGLLGGLL